MVFSLPLNQVDVSLALTDRKFNLRDEQHIKPSWGTAVLLGGNTATFYCVTELVGPASPSAASRIVRGLA